MKFVLILSSSALLRGLEGQLRVTLCLSFFGTFILIHLVHFRGFRISFLLFLGLISSYFRKIHRI